MRRADTLTGRWPTRPGFSADSSRKTRPGTQVMYNHAILSPHKPDTPPGGIDVKGATRPIDLRSPDIAAFLYAVHEVVLEQRKLSATWVCRVDSVGTGFLKNGTPHSWVGLEGHDKFR